MSDCGEPSRDVSRLHSAMRSQVSDSGRGEALFRQVDPPGGQTAP